jgi:hypothetical protein
LVNREMRTSARPQRFYSADEYHHQKILKSAANEARNFLRDALARLDAVDADADFSTEGKRRQRAEVARAMIAKAETSKRSPVLVKLRSMRCRGTARRSRASLNPPLTRSGRYTCANPAAAAFH